MARTIGSLTAVRSAQVHVVIPQPTLFSDVEAKSRFLREGQTEMGRLAVAIAKKIIGKESTLCPIRYMRARPPQDLLVLQRKSLEVPLLSFYDAFT